MWLGRLVLKRNEKSPTVVSIISLCWWFILIAKPLFVLTSDIHKLTRASISDPFSPEDNGQTRTIENLAQPNVSFRKIPLTVIASLIRTSSRSTKELPPKRVEDEQAEETRKCKAKQELRRQTPTERVVSAIASSNGSFVTSRLKIHKMIAKNDPNPDKFSTERFVRPYHSVKGVITLSCRARKVSRIVFLAKKSHRLVNSSMTIPIFKVTINSHANVTYHNKG